LILHAQISTTGFLKREQHRVQKMLNVRWFAGLGIPRKEFSIALVLLFNTFTWYYMTLMVMESIPLDGGTISAFRAVFYLTAIGAGIAGAILSEKTERISFLYFWFVIGIVGSIPLSLISNLTPGHLSIIFILMGLTFGVGMPSCLTYLADSTSVENRGRVSALIFLLVNLSAFPLAIVISEFGIVMSSVVLFLWRALGLGIFFILKPQRKNIEKNRRMTFASLFQDRSFILYLIPWLMFNIIDALETALLKDFFGPAFYQLTFTVKPAIASIAILFGGLLSDFIGRKRVVIYGFVSLGIAYAIIGLAPSFTLTWNFFMILDAIATGVLWVTFILILWGDLAPESSREKYYAIGSLPFLLTAAIPLSLVSLFNFLPVSASFSLAGFFIFLAVLPLMYAPETMPQKKIEQRRFKAYIEQAKKASEQYLEKNFVKD
jgi:MFS family permease